MEKVKDLWSVLGYYLIPDIFWENDEMIKDLVGGNYIKVSPGIVKVIKKD